MQRLLAMTIAALLLCTNARATDDKLRLGYPAGMNGQIITILDKTNLAKKHGLDIDYSFFQNGPPMMEAFAAGQLDIAVTSLMPLTTYAARLPGSAVIVSGLGSSTYGLLVRSDNPAGTLADLKGKRIALSFGSDSHLDLLASLAEADINPASGVALLNVQPAELPVALERGLADAIVIRQPQLLKLRQTSGARLIKSWPHRFVVLARASFLERQPETIDHLLAALTDSVTFIAANPDQSAAWFGEKLGIDPQTVKKVSAENPLIANSSETRLGITPDLRDATSAWVAAAYRWGLVKTVVDPERLFASPGL